MKMRNTMRRILFCAFLWILPYGHLCEPVQAEPLSLGERASMLDARPTYGFGHVFGKPLFIEGGLGLTQFLKTSDDGVWIQDRMPHATNWQDVAIRAGVGVKLHESWSVGANYLRLGQVALQSTWQSDLIYESRCGLSCNHYAGNLWSRMQGGELVGTYHPQLWAVSPIVRAGVAVFEHSVRWETNNDARGVHEYRGVIVAGVLGAGACYQTWACVDLSYYRGFADTYYPLSNAAIISMATLKYAF